MSELRLAGAVLLLAVGAGVFFGLIIDAVVSAVSWFIRRNRG